MTIKTYFLSEDKTVYLKAYMLDNVEGLPFCEKRPGILILPGGGYEYCSAREGEPVAMHYLAEGYNAFVLIYSCNARHPAPLLNASYAILKLRQRCEEFGIDPNKLAVWGASAGGHLTACTATMWQDPSIYKALGCKPEDIRPDAAILSYPVISGTTNPHKGSFDVLLGKDATRDELSKLSIENRVTPKTPPIFLWCTANDDCVPAQNSLVMAKACVSNKVPVELHMFDCGPHGLSTCDKVTGWNEAFYLDNCKQWIKMSVDFLAKYLGV